jgi:hypothetical protein
MKKKTFNEWITKSVGELPELSTPNLGMQTMSDEVLALNQLDQLVDRVRGVLYNVSEEKRNELMEIFISNLQSRV